jgi:hypothetical protein
MLLEGENEVLPEGEDEVLPEGGNEVLLEGEDGAFPEDDDFGRLKAGDTFLAQTFDQDQERTDIDVIGLLEMDVQDFPHSRKSFVSLQGLDVFLETVHPRRGIRLPEVTDDAMLVRVSGS